MAAQKRSGRGRSSGSSSRSRRSMSLQEGGRRGGRVVAEKYGPEYYRNIGQKGRHARWDEGEDEDYEGYEAQGENENYGRRQRRGGYEQHRRAGLAGASARWGKDYDENEEYEEEGGGRRQASRYDQDYNDEDENYEEDRGYRRRARGYEEDEDYYNEDEGSSRRQRRGGSREQHQRTGHLGGEAVARKYGPEFYSEIGRKGGRERQGRRRGG